MKTSITCKWTTKKPDLTEKEKIQVKNVAKELLTTLKVEKLVIDWRKNSRL